MEGQRQDPNEYNCIVRWFSSLASFSVFLTDICKMSDQILGHPHHHEPFIFKYISLSTALVLSFVMPMRPI